MISSDMSTYRQVLKLVILKREFLKSSKTTNLRGETSKAVV